MTRLFFFPHFLSLNKLHYNQAATLFFFFFRSAVPYSAVEQNDPAAFAVYCDVALMEMTSTPDFPLLLKRPILNH